MIGFVGLSHLGIISSIAAASKGFNVVAYDPDRSLCDDLRNGRLPVFEPDLPDLLTNNRARIRFTCDRAELKQCGLVYFSVDVSTDEDNRSDLTALDQLIGQVIAHVSPGTVIVILSQVPPGFTRKLANNLGGSFHLFYQVETLIFGRAVERAVHPERFIVGCSHPKGILPLPYDTLLRAFDCPILQMRYESAELAKISINIFLVSSVSVTNMLAELCEAIGADWWEIAPALKLDKRIGPYAYLSPGLGIGGGNLGRDMATLDTLAREFGTDAGLIDTWLSNSHHRRDWVLRILHSRVLSQCVSPEIAIWGLAYKADTTTTKNSPSLALIEALSPFSVRAYDPQAVLREVRSPSFLQVNSAFDACRGVDVLAIMTPWREFSLIDIARVRELMVGRIIIDPFNTLDSQRCAELGFSHFRLGSPAEIQGHTG